MMLSIVGSRSYTNYNDFCQHMKKYVNKNGLPASVISGGAIGTDTMAEKWCDENDIPIKIIKPDYQCKDGIKKHGKNLWMRIAPLERNKDIADECDTMIAFIKDNSKGTNHIVRYAKSIGKDVTTVNNVL
jgi:hypothetical protein